MPDLSTQHSEVNPDLIARGACGDAAAFGQIYACTVRGVRRYVRTIIWNRWDAEDVTQEVFLKIFTRLDQYDPERGSFSSWTLRLARNAAIDHMRRQRGGIACADIENTAALDDAGQRCAESLRLVLSELNQNQREILVLRALAGFEPSEVARYSRSTRGAVNTHYHRARLAARDRLRAIDAGPSTCGATKRRPDALLSEAA
jgi:RNA polymerase sigma-70 factor (ECF subfamily)